MEYIENLNDINVNLEENEPGIIVIALDESTSMRGKHWNDAVEGVKNLINYVKSYHKN